MSTNIPVKEKNPDAAIAKGQKKETALVRELPTLRYSPRTDVLETKEAYVLTLDMPGAGKDTVSANFEEGVVTVKGEVKKPDMGNRKSLHRPYGTKEYYRSFQLPDGVDSTKIEAKLQDGVLTVQLPKAEAVRPRQIRVKTN